VSSATLTSLAMLKVNVDQGRDYLDYLRPFILQVLCDHKPNPVTDAVVRDHIRSDFGLEIPERAVQMVIKRLSRKHPLTREHGVYRITGDLPNPGIATEKADADRHIRAVVAGLKEFSKDTARPITSDDEAVQAICVFLAEFNIPCLRAYLRGTAIPDIQGKQDSNIVLVSQYIVHLQNSDPERLGSFMVLVQGHMLANGLLCPDLQSVPKTYKGVAFYFDTPLLIQRMGLEGKAKQRAAEELMALLHNLGATVAMFSHTRAEINRVIRGAADYIDSVDGRGAIVLEARRNETTKSDLLLLAGRVDDLLKNAGVVSENTPAYVEKFQIDENVFENTLDDEISYYNPRAKADDVNSVRSIYVLRKGQSPSSVEKCKAALVTSNAAFSRAAFEYGKQYEESREVSSVITAFSLANMAWLKAPMGAPSLPATEILAYAYAALRPSKELLDKYLVEIDKLQQQGDITERDHQLLRSSTLAQDELMRLTLGEDEALTEQTVTETLKRVIDETKKEESEKLTAEQAAHRKTQEELAAERLAKKEVQERIFWRCSRRAKQYSWAVAVVVGLALVAGIVAGLGVTSSNPVAGWILIAVATVAGVADLLLDFSVRRMREKLDQRLLTWMLRREASRTGIDFGEVESCISTKPRLRS